MVAISISLSSKLRVHTEVDVCAVATAMDAYIRRAAAHSDDGDVT